MNYTLIGTGNVAYFLSQRCYEQGYKCVGIFGRNKEEAAKLASVIHTSPVADLKDLPETDCCIIAISDRSIHEISKQLHLKETVVIHTAGSVSLDAIVQPNKAVLWPVYSINKENLPDHRNIPLIYEYQSEKAEAIVTRLAYTISDIVQPVNWQQRRWLHLCAVLGNNFINHLMALCEAICEEQELSFSLIRPILHQTFEIATSLEPSRSQTGPAIRNDKITQEKHLELLQQHPLWQQVYQSLSVSIEDMYKTGKK